MRKPGGFFLLLGLLAALVLAASAAAMRDMRGLTVPSRITMGYNAAADVFSGKVTSKSKGCVARRLVDLKRVAPGPDRTVARTRTNAKGSWRIASPRGARSLAARQFDPGEYYSGARKVKVKSKAAQQEICASAKSRTVRVEEPLEDFGCQARADDFPPEDVVAVFDCQKPVTEIDLEAGAPIQKFDASLRTKDGQVVRGSLCVSQSQGELSCPLNPPWTSMQEVFVVFIAGLPSGTRIDITVMAGATRHTPLSLTTK